MNVGRSDAAESGRSGPRRSLPPDARLLLACAARGPDADALGAHFDEDGAWPGLVERAVRHRLGPLVYATLRAASDAGAVRPPDTLMARLRTIYDRHVTRTARRIATLEEIGPALERAGIPMIVLKGAALGPTLYGDPALRTMGDVDLLVPRHRRTAASQALQALGYVPDVSWRSATWYHARHHHLAPLRAPDGALDVELHHLIVERGDARVPVDELWARARWQQIGGGSFRVLAAEDLLLHLCLHLVRDNCVVQGQLRDLRDVAQLIRHEAAALDWTVVVERARAWEVAAYTYWALWLARDMVGAPVPAVVLDRLGDEARLGRRADLLRRLLPELLVASTPWPFRLPPWLVVGAVPLLVHADRLASLGAVAHRVRRAAKLTLDHAWRFTWAARAVRRLLGRHGAPPSPDLQLRVGG
jgi:hypothetical protein